MSGNDNKIEFGEATVEDIKGFYIDDLIFYYKTFAILVNSPILRCEV